MKKLLLVCLLFTVYASGFGVKPSVLGKSASTFLENKGQIIDQDNRPNPGVLYLFNAQNLKVQLHKNGFSYEVITREQVEREKSYQDVKENNNDRVKKTRTIIHSHRVDVELVGCNSAAVITPLLPAPGYTNYYTDGTGEMGVTGVKDYSKVLYSGIYPNIDLEYAVQDGKFKYNFIVHPGGDIHAIKMKYDGANKVFLNKKGEIEMFTAQGTLQENIPYSYTEESKKAVNVYYTSSAGVFGFKGNYDNTKTLVIDPTPNRTWGTYYGGMEGAEGNTVAVDGSGNTFLGGATPSVGYIASGGAHQTVYGGSYDGFVVKLDGSGATRAWGTYYGGSVTDEIYCMKVDGNGNVYFSGKTSSTNAISTPGAHQTSNGGPYDVMLVKLNSAGVRQWGTYYGGTGDEYAMDMTLDANANIFLTGWTMSPNAMATAGAYMSTYPGAGNFSAFAAEFNSSGVRQWGTYYGDASGTVRGEGIALDGSGNVYIAGATTATSGIAAGGGFQQVNGGGFDAFAAKFNSTGTSLSWGTYLGDVYDDQGWDITVDGAGNVLFVGLTGSLSNIATPGAHQTVYGGNFRDGFMAKLTSGGARTWCTYYGSFDDDQIYSVITDASNDIYFAGDSWSTSGIATAGAYQVAWGGANDGMIAKFNSAGVRQWCTVYGDIGSEDVRDIALASGNDVVVGGFVGSDFVMGSPGAYQPVRTNQNPINVDAFMAKFGAAGGGGGQAPVASFSVNDQTICQGTCINFTDNSNNTPTAWSWTFPGSNTPSTNAQNPSNVCYNTPGTYTATLTASNAYGNSSATKTITVFPLPNICAAATNQSICAGSTTTLTSCGGASYTWQPGNLNGAQVNVSPNVTTTYTVTGTDANGCTNNGTITIYVSNNPLPSVSLSNLAAVCVDAAPFALSGGSPAGGTYSGPGVTNNQFDPSAAGVGSHAIVYTYTDPNNGCYNSATKNQVVNALPPQPTIGVNFNVLTSSAASGNQWYLNGTPINGATSQSYTMNGGGAYMVCITDANSCVSCSQPVNMNNVGISDLFASGKMRVFPNPFEDRLVVQAEGAVNAKIFLYNTLGQLLVEESLEKGSAVIETGKFEKGVYFLQVRSGDAVVMKKLLKQ